MNIRDFHKKIDRTILSRGHDYYTQGSVIESFTTGDNDYSFIVEGSEDYEVTIRIDEAGEILYSHCDCPYDFGPICKHQVAAVFELSEMLNADPTNLAVKKEMSKQPALKDVLHRLTKEELIDILMDLAKKNQALKESLIFRFANGEGKQEVERCKKMIDAIVRKYTGREGFIPYRQTYDFINELEEVLDNIRKVYGSKRNLLLGLDVAFILLEEAIEAFQYADDSNGEIGGFVSEVMQFIEEMVDDSKGTEYQIKEKMFKKLFEKIDNKVFDGWEEYRVGILDLCALFADVGDFRAKLRTKIEDIVSKNSRDKYMKYTNERLLLILSEMITKYGTKTEAKEFMKQNLNYSAFRVMYIEQCMKEKNYSKVIDLAFEGERKDAEYAGLVLKWKNIRYTAYKKLMLKEEQVKLAKDLLFKGQFEYYKELKELHKDDGEMFYQKLKEELRALKSWQGKSMFLKLIVEKKDLTELIEYVRINPATIKQYAHLLIARYKHEVIHVYSHHIKQSASSATNRKQYQEVCRIIKGFKKIAGEDNKVALIKELTMLYNRRPAFLDELRKVK